VIGNAVRVMEIATGQRDEEYEDDPGKNKAAAKLGRKGGMDFREATLRALREARARRPCKGPRRVSPSRAASTPVERIGSASRPPPTDWPHAVIRLAEERVGHYRALIREMQEAQR
jgi:hypothetical protein